MHKTPWMGAIAVVACACAPAFVPPGDEGDSEPEETVDAPRFVDPANGRLTLLADRTDDADLMLEHALQQTQLEVDGDSVGTLVPATETGVRIGNTLTLHLEGALVDAPHRMELFHEGSVDTLYSGEVEVDIVQTEFIELSHEVGPGPAGNPEIMGSGEGGGEMLLALEPAAEGLPAELTIYPPDGAGWDFDAARTVELPGLALAEAIDEGSEAPITVRLAGEDMRVAWTAGITPDTIYWRDVDPDGVASEIEAAAWVGGPGLDVGFEWAVMGRPVFAGPSLLVEAHARTDTEMPRPGDHRVLAVRFLGDEVQSVERVLPGLVTDLDLVRPTFDPRAIAYGGPARVSVRVAGWHLGSLEADRYSGFVVVDAPAHEALPSLAGAYPDARALAGAFGSSTVASIGPAGVELYLASMTTGVVRDDVVPAETTWPEGDPSGALASTIVAGTPVVLVPWGEEAPVHVLVSNGADARVVELPGLFCEEVVVATSVQGNREGRAGLACAGSLGLEVGGLDAAAGE